MITLSFISANYVAEASGYNGSHDWGTHDRATKEAASPARFRAMAKRVKALGFDRLDVWMGHCHYDVHGVPYAREVGKICAEEGLIVTSYAGGIKAERPEDLDKAFGFMREMGATLFAGGIWGMPADQLIAAIEAACQRHGVVWAFENHPEKSVEEMLARFGGGRFAHCGMALDTGFCGTHRLDAAATMRAVLPHLRIVHLKDVKALGGHDTVTLGDGVVDVRGALNVLKEAGWSGNVCIEHEPYDHDPTDDVRVSLERVREWLAA